MSARPGGRHGAVRGFVLVGVVMMVLALTILGISLYSLSGYESQFFSRSYLERQSLYTASGGVELAKALLTTRLGSPPDYRLSNVARAIGREGIVSAVAWQEGSPPDSTGPVDWSKDIHVKVGVQVSGVSRTLAGRYAGALLHSPYHNVFTAPAGIHTDHQDNTRPTILVGRVWQPIESPEDTAWVRELDDDSNISFIDGDVPSPGSAAFLASHSASASAVMTHDPPTSTTTLVMDAGGAPDATQFFSATTDTNSDLHALLSPYFDFYSDQSIQLRIRGTVVWLVPRGSVITGDFVVSRLDATPSTLIMVVGPNERFIAPAPYAVGDQSHYGPQFGKGIKIASSNTCVFVVSHGTTAIERHWEGEQFVANGLSVFSNRIEFKGPEYKESPPPGEPNRKDMTLAYASWMELVANSLMGRGLLPSAVGIAASQWTLRPGSWTTSPGLQ